MNARTGFLDSTHLVEVLAQFPNARTIKA